MENDDDVETNIQKLIELAARLNTRRFENAIEIKNMLMEAVAMKRSFAEKYMAFIELDTKIRILERNLKDQNTAAMNASMHFEQCKKEAETRREQLALAKRNAESIARITPELAHEFLETQLIKGREQQQQQQPPQQQQQQMQMQQLIFQRHAQQQQQQ